MLAYAPAWVVAVIIETLLSLNPLFASGFIWIKYQFSYLWWLADDPLNPTPGLDFWSFNRALPALIGMTVSLIYCSIMICKLNKKGASASANDGNIKKIQENRETYPTVSDADMNPESSSFFEDDLVTQERERVSKIINRQNPSETLAVYNLKKFYIVKKPKDKKQDDNTALGDSEEDKSKSNIVKAI